MVRSVHRTFRLVILNDLRRGFLLTIFGSSVFFHLPRSVIGLNYISLFLHGKILCNFIALFSISYWAVSPPKVLVKILICKAMHKQGSKVLAEKKMLK